MRGLRVKQLRPDLIFLGQGHCNWPWSQADPTCPTCQKLSKWLRWSKRYKWSGDQNIVGLVAVCVCSVSCSRCFEISAFAMFSYILVFILLSTQYFQLNSKYWETRCTADTTPDTICYDWTDNKLNSVLLCQWLLHNPTQPKPKPNGCVLLLHSSILYYTTYPKAVPQSLGCAHNSNLRFLIKHCSIFEAGETDHWPLTMYRLTSGWLAGGLLIKQTDWLNINSVLLCQWLLHNPTQPKPKPRLCTIIAFLHTILYYISKSCPSIVGLCT